MDTTATIIHAEENHATICADCGGDGHRNLALLVRQRGTTDEEWRGLMRLIDQADIIRDAAREVVAAWSSRRLAEAVRGLDCLLRDADEIEVGETR